MVSDPITEFSGLPIPAGEISFGSGAELQRACMKSLPHNLAHHNVGVGRAHSNLDSNGSSRDAFDIMPLNEDISKRKVRDVQYEGDLQFVCSFLYDGHIGTWSKWLNDRFSVDTNADNTANENNTSASEVKWFDHLNSLSHILMVPKDMLTDKSIRADVCLSINLMLPKRILQNFTPDEFCPDSVPNTILEEIDTDVYMYFVWVGGGHSSLDSNGSSRDAFDIMPLNEDISKRKVRDVQYEGDLQFVLSFMYVACMYETMVNEVNMRLSSLDGMSEKTIGVVTKLAFDQILFLTSGGAFGVDNMGQKLEK
ncbi:hypothetical protein Tco_0804676 [Tanacetum coccineum]|uniref:Uncharacterized protein n=1 Tax=Tanacetum coccineum TaxID=301880 RepID=A0ABQ5A6Q0_9ASTR